MSGRTLLRGTGELLITAGLVLLLFCAYQLYWTNFEARRDADRVSEQIRDAWERPGPAPTPSAVRSSDFGRGFAFLHVPRLGKDFNVPVVEGVTLDDLARGVGHYPETAGPGEVGNFAVAGHRATHGEPFRDMDRVRRGDAVVAETKDTWYTYRVDRIRIVAPSDVWVIQPVPGKPRAEPTEALLTLTTCNPRWASTERMVVFGHLETTQPKSAGTVPDVLAAGG
ncbi:MAG: class E sortase [Actinomycetes bacterium]